MKTTIEKLDQPKIDRSSATYRNLQPFVILLAMECALFFLAAILPLRGLATSSSDALLTQLGLWPLFPTFLLFPHSAVSPVLPGLHGPFLYTSTISGKDTALLFCAFLSIFLLYLLALRILPRSIGKRYLLLSTLLLAITCCLVPVVTSSDIFSYIAYARIGVIYHLNPLTTLPTAIRNDPIFAHLYWIGQPSAYGPTWTLLTCLIQWLAVTLGLKGLLSMVLGLRLLGLTMHLGSTALIWSTSGHLQRYYDFLSAEKRLRATLAFAWNPLLLFEACVNAHNDTTLLFFILLGIWFLVRNLRPGYPLRLSLGELLLASALFALATCLKLNALVLAPGLLLFLWIQRQKMLHVLAAAMTYLGLIMLLYAPFWQHGAIFGVVKVNPEASRNINSPADFLTRLYNGLAAHFGARIAAPIGSPAEHLFHTASLALFLILSILLCWRTAHNPKFISTFPRLIRWMAIAWLCYCLTGASWYWPWYITTFFGFSALIEATSDSQQAFSRFLAWPPVTRLLAFSMLSFYCFSTSAFSHTPLSMLPGFHWANFSGLWIWIVPLLVAGTLGLKRIYCALSRSWSLR